MYNYNADDVISCLLFWPALFTRYFANSESFSFQFLRLDISFSFSPLSLHWLFSLSSCSRIPVACLVAVLTELPSQGHTYHLALQDTSWHDSRTFSFNFISIIPFTPTFLHAFALLVFCVAPPPPLAHSLKSYHSLSTWNDVLFCCDIITFINPSSSRDCSLWWQGRTCHQWPMTAEGAMTNWVTMRTHEVSWCCHLATHIFLQILPPTFLWQNYCFWNDGQRYQNDGFFFLIFCIRLNFSRICFKFLCD